MKRILISAAVAGAMALATGVATSANAANFVGTDTVSGYPFGGPNSNNGLDIVISNPTGLNFNLSSVGQSTGFIDLFTIYTDEHTLEFDDTIDHNLTLAFNFTAPTPGATGGFGGETDGSFDGFFFFGFPIGGDGAEGTLGWSSTQTFLNFGSGYQLKVNLESQGETFNAGSEGNDFNPGVGNGALVRANFTLTQMPAGVPEPASWALMIGGFGMTGAMLRRRRTTVATA